jgi:hypothetical protein
MLLLIVGFAAPSLTPFEISPSHDRAAFLRDISRCLEHDHPFLPTNTSDALAHYAQLRDYMSTHRHVRRLPYRDCSGPFLEDEFVPRIGTNRSLSSGRSSR